MQTIIEALRQIVGETDFYHSIGTYNATWDYGVMLEYMMACTILCIVISWVFRLLKAVFDR